MSLSHAEFHYNKKKYVSFKPLNVKHRSVMKFLEEMWDKKSLSKKQFTWGAFD